MAERIVLEDTGTRAVNRNNPLEHEEVPLAGEQFAALEVDITNHQSNATMGFEIKIVARDAQGAALLTWTAIRPNGNDQTDRWMGLSTGVLPLATATVYFEAAVSAASLQTQRRIRMSDLPIELDTSQA